MVDKLAGLRPRGGESCAPNHVVQASLEQSEQVLTCDTRLASRQLVIAAELPFEDPIHGAQLLLLSKLDLVVGNLRPAAAMLTRWIGPAISRALLRLAQWLARAPAGAMTGTCL